MQQEINTRAHKALNLLKMYGDAHCIQLLVASVWSLAYSGTILKGMKFYLTYNSFHEHFISG